MLQQLSFVRYFHILEQNTDAVLRTRLTLPESVSAPLPRCCCAGLTTSRSVGDMAPRYGFPSPEAGAIHSVSPSKRTASRDA